MTNDFYCDEVLSGKTQVDKIYETEHTLAYYHTKPFYQIHFVAIPKVHIPSLTKIMENEEKIL